MCCDAVIWQSHLASWSSCKLELKHPGVQVVRSSLDPHNLGWESEETKPHGPAMPRWKLQLRWPKNVLVRSLSPLGCTAFDLQQPWDSSLSLMTFDDFTEGRIDGAGRGRQNTLTWVVLVEVFVEHFHGFRASSAGRSPRIYSRGTKQGSRWVTAWVSQVFHGLW